MRSHAKAASASSTHRENGTFSLGVIAAMLVCAAAFLGIGAPAASAAPEAGPGWSFKGSFGELSPFVLESPQTPVALDGNGNIFAADQLSETVNAYTPSEASGGEFLTSIATSGGSPRNLAIDQSTGTVYVDFAFGSTVKRWTSDGQPTPTYTVDPSFEVPQGQGLAVDPTNGNLLVADSGAEAVRRYNASGTLLETIGTPSISPSWLLAMADGSFYVAPAGGPDLTHFSGSGTNLGTIAGVGSLHGLSYDSARNVLVASVGDKLVTYSPAGGRQAESSAQNGAGVGIVVDGSSSRLYEHPGAGALNYYVPGTVPGVEAPTVSSLTPTGFHVSTEVDPGAGPPAGSVVRFEYRLVGAASWIATADQSVGALGTYEADVTGLEPNREYQVRAVAGNEVISTSTGAVSAATAVAPPGTETRPASDVRETSAVLNGTINPFGLQTTYYFEYGPTTAYGTRIPAGSEGVAGQGRAAKFFSRIVFGLTPGTTYHFRLVATNSAGTAEGPDQSFTTVAAGASPVRAYEQVSPADKQGVVIASALGVRASNDGDMVSYVAKSGSNSSPLFSRSMAVRGSSDWQGGIGVDPPLAVAAGYVIAHLTLATAADSSHAFVVSNQALAPGATAGNANLYRSDPVNGTYEFIGGTGGLEALGSFTSFSTSSTFQAGAPDLSWIYFFSVHPLLPGAPMYGMYRWSVSGGLELASVLPNGEGSSAVHQSHYQYWEPASADGSRFYFIGSEGSEEGVFLREGTETKVVSHRPGEPNTPRPATLLGASKNGRYAFLLSEEELTNDAPGSRGVLYRYDASDGSLEYLGAQVFAETLCGPFGCVQNYGSFGISADGQTIYFDKANDTGQFRVDFAVWHDGVVQTIRAGTPDPETGEIGGGAVAVNVEFSSPNGRYFVFGDQIDGEPALVRYDAETEEIECVTCLPDGTSATANTGSTDPDSAVGNRWPRVVDDNGTVYFDTEAPLVAADVNGMRDVYTWNDGVPTLISPGNEPFNAVIGDVSADGSDIFFATAQGLVKRDTDGQTDIYDARLNGGLPVQNSVPPEECQRDCKLPPGSEAQPLVGGSEAMNGPGNVKPQKKPTCGKGKHRAKVNGKAKCVKNGKKHRASKDRKGGNR